MFRNMTMWRFAALLTGRLDRPVVDATSLTGVYDFNLELQSLRDLPSSIRKQPKLRGRLVLLVDFSDIWEAWAQLGSE
jgi:uncharacterized protein (TIGR03435 family)